MSATEWEFEDDFRRQKEAAKVRRSAERKQRIAEAAQRIERRRERLAAEHERLRIERIAEDQARREAYERKRAEREREELALFRAREEERRLREALEVEKRAALWLTMGSLGDVLRSLVAPPAPSIGQAVWTDYATYLKQKEGNENA